MLFSRYKLTENNLILLFAGTAMLLKLEGRISSADNADIDVKNLYKCHQTFVPNWTCSNVDAFQTRRIPKLPLSTPYTSVLLASASCQCTKDRCLCACSKIPERLIKINPVSMILNGTLNSI